MNVLVVGGGGREHAIVWKLLQSPGVTRLFCAPGNGGIEMMADCVSIKATDTEGIVAFAKDNAIDYVVVAPDDPLAAGMVDALEREGIPAFGPNKAAARIESSKTFSKALMKKYGIPTADYEEFDNPDKADAYIDGAPLPMVVKADGLALGKGVIICEDAKTAHEAVDDIMRKRKFGASGSKIIIEEFITGPEVSILAFTDGKTVKPMVSAQDHKRALDFDKGLNTGGMGTFAPSPKYTEQVKKEFEEKIMLQTVRAMQSEGCPFKGCLYYGLMLTPDGVKVLEYNSRFGDPETQVVLPLLESDLLEIMLACTNGTLENIDIEWSDGAAACVVLASGGYPQEYKTGYEINGLLDLDGAIDFHAGTRRDGEKTVTAGGRVLGITALGNTLEDAIKNAYRNVKKVSFKDMHYRTDIGRK